MGDDKTQEPLLQLVQDTSFVKAKLSNIEEQRLATRIDQLKAQVVDTLKEVLEVEELPE